MDRHANKTIHTAGKETLHEAEGNFKTKACFPFFFHPPVAENLGFLE